MSKPVNMIVGNSVSSSDVSYIYESLTSYGEDLAIGYCYLDNFSLSSEPTNPLNLYKLNILTYNTDVKKITDDYDIDDVFSSYSIDADASNEGHIVKLQWINNNNRQMIGTAISMQAGSSAYKWIEITRSFK